MCNHYDPADDPQEMEFAIQTTLQRLGIVPPDYFPGLEAYPKRQAPIIRKRPEGFFFEPLRWGITVTIQGRTNYVTNARNDKLLKGYPWRYSLRERRCLIPARGYFEPGTGPVGARGEILFTLKDRPWFFIAGLWDTDPGENGAHAFTMVTTEPNGLAARFHDRMPLVLSDADAKLWLGDQPLPAEEVTRLCQPPPEDIMQHVEIAAKPKEKAPKKIAKDDLFGGELLL